VGAIQLAPDTHDHHTYFEPGEEIFLYHDLESCFKAAKSILSLSPDDALAIRNSTRSRSLKDEYTYKSRAIMALNLIKEY
jgi:spore maturation protein CgeB